MSELDKRALEANFEAWAKERAPDLEKTKAFERYCVEQVLKDADLSDDEIESGNFGGADDGGVDAMYFFVNRVLITDESEMPDSAVSVRLAIIQAKYEAGFKEEAIQKLHQFAQDLLDYARDPASIEYLNPTARDAIARFRENYNKVLGSPHKLTIDFHYAVRGDTPPNPKVTARVDLLKKFIVKQISSVDTAFEFWGCRRLLDSARAQPTKEFVLQVSEKFFSDDGTAVVCIAKLKDFVSFLSDEQGELRRSFLEPNVRDYQGKGNPVNKDIRRTLNSADTKEFWWLNNGVTILATKHSFSGNKLVIEKPEIVNGLQTSQEIFAHFKEYPDKKDSRNVLIRVIAPPDEPTRNRIIKATNNQTAVSPVSLRATDDIHFDIEDKFRAYNLFYDRRKGEHRHLKRPIAQIVSIPTLAKAVIAIKMMRPDEARARPQSVLSKEDTYTQVFNNEYDRDVYVTCIHLDRKVDEYLGSRSDLSAEIHRDIRYYIDMWIACKLCGTTTPTVAQLVAIRPLVVKGISDELLEEAFEGVIVPYIDLGGSEKVAKGPELRNELLKKLGAVLHA